MFDAPDQGAGFAAVLSGRVPEIQVAESENAPQGEHRSNTQRAMRRTVK